MNNIDFLPEQLRARRDRHRRLLRYGYLLAGCVVALAMLGYMRQGRVSRAKAELCALEEIAARNCAKLNLRKEMEARRAELRIVARIESDLGGRTNVLDVLAELERVMSESIVLTGLSLETVTVRKAYRPARPRRAPVVASVKATQDAIKRIRLVITALSPTDVGVANFFGKLSASPLFEDVNMGYTRNVKFRSRDVREFQASCYIVR